MSQYELIKQQISEAVPFAKHTGIELVAVGDGLGEALLPEQETSKNHIGSQHAGALFTLAEAASGAAMAGGFMSLPFAVKSVAAKASIRYLKIAKGAIKANAVTSRATLDLQTELKSQGKVQFSVGVSLRDHSDVEVAIVDVDWHVAKVKTI